MYLRSTGSGQAFLYLQQDQGRTLAILDVTNPASIREVGRASLGAQAEYDFVQALSDSAALIHYRDRSGFAIISFRKYKQPLLVATPELQTPASIKLVGERTVLLTSANGPSATSQNSQCAVIDISDPLNPTSLVVIHGVRQQLERPETGTIFLLGKDGLTVIRHLSMEEEYQQEINQTN